jgi:hypothetical protein
MTTEPQHHLTFLALCIDGAIVSFCFAVMIASLCCITALVRRTFWDE